MEDASANVFLVGWMLGLVAYVAVVYCFFTRFRRLPDPLIGITFGLMLVAFILGGPALIVGCYNACVLITR